jgi:hypothetical protein
MLQSLGLRLEENLIVMEGGFEQLISSTWDII